VHRFVKAWRNERIRVPVHAYVPMSFAPGEAYQFDWSHETITLAGLPLAVKAAHMKLSHSRMPFVRIYFRETQELVRTVGPARMIVESLTPRPGIREQYRPEADNWSLDPPANRDILDVG
jgi:hypothetical protein